jgi:predicted transcriptional regulator
MLKITKGRALMHRRRRLDVKAKELAQMLGWPASSISKMENGRCESSDERFAMAYEALDRIEEEIPKK